MPTPPSSTDRPGPAARATVAGLDLLAVAASAAVAGLMVFLVVARYVLGLSIVGLHELIMGSAMVLYMTGALIASRRGEHLTVDWLSARLAEQRGRQAHRLFVGLVTAVVAAAFCVWSGRMIAWGLERPQLTPAWRIPVWTLQLPIVAAAAGSLLYALRDVGRALRALRR